MSGTTDQQQAAPLLGGGNVEGGSYNYPVTNVPPALQGGLDGSSGTGTTTGGSTVGAPYTVTVTPGTATSGGYGSGLNYDPSTGAIYGGYATAPIFSGTQANEGAGAYSAGSAPGIGFEPGIYGGPEELGISGGLASDAANWFKGLGTNIMQGIESAALGFVAPIGQWVERGFLIIVGIVLVAIALIELMSRSKTVQRTGRAIASVAA